MPKQLCMLQGARGAPRAARGRAAWRKGHLILMESW